MTKRPWNSCDVCGRFIPFMDLWRCVATRTLVTPLSESTKEEYETLCRYHAEGEQKMKESGG